jgi:hypothetical protein
MKKLVDGVLRDMTQAEIDALPKPPTASEVLTQRRSEVTLTRLQLCMKCRDIGLFSNPVAVNAAAGEWPAPLDTALSILSEDQQADARMEWSSAQVIHRDAPTILLLQWHLSYTDEQVDALFGIDP